METLRLVALFSVLANVYSKAVDERATINAFVSSDGTRFERASTNAECCSTNSILMTEDGTEYRWPITTDKAPFKCGGGMKKTFNEWLDFTVEHNKKMAGFKNICFEGWRYTISEGCTAEDLARHHGEEFTIADHSEQNGLHYEYKLILGQSITQKHTGSSAAELSIGTYVSGEGDTEFYKNGDGEWCPDGVARESEISFVQGEQPELIETSEPSVCKYKFVFQINCKDGNDGSAEVTTETPAECTYDDYGRFYEAAHNNVMTEVVRYVEEHNCCPSVPAGRYGETALWVAAQRGNDDILAYLKTVGACADDYDPANYDLDRTDGDAGVDFPE